MSAPNNELGHLTVMGPSGFPSLKPCKVSPVRKVQLSLDLASTSSMKTFPAVHLLVLGRSVSGQWRARELAEETGVRDEIREAASQVMNGLLGIIRTFAFTQSQMGSHCRGLSREVTRPDLH